MYRPTDIFMYIYYLLVVLNNYSLCQESGINVTKTTKSNTIVTTKPSIKSTRRPKSKYSFITSTVTNYHFITVAPGDPVELDCRIHEFLGKPNVTWNKDGRPVNDQIFRFYYHDHFHHTYLLVFNEILPTEAGEYQCSVGNDGEEKITKTFSIKVEEPLDSKHLKIDSLSPTLPTVLEMGSIEFTCSGKGENNLPKSFRWDVLLLVNYTTVDDNAVIWKSNKNNKVYKVVTLKTELCSNGFSKLHLHNISYEYQQAIITCVVFNKKRYDMTSTEIFVTELIIEPQPEKLQTPATIIIVVVVIFLLFILSVVVFAIRKWKMKYKRKRTKSYHYEPPSSQ